MFLLPSSSFHRCMYLYIHTWIEVGTQLSAALKKKTLRALALVGGRTEQSITDDEELFFCFRENIRTRKENASPHFPVPNKPPRPTQSRDKNLAQDTRPTKPPSRRRAPWRARPRCPCPAFPGRRPLAPRPGRRRRSRRGRRRACRERCRSRTSL